MPVRPCNSTRNRRLPVALWMFVAMQIYWTSYTILIRAAPSHASGEVQHAAEHVVHHQEDDITDTYGAGQDPADESPNEVMEPTENSLDQEEVSFTSSGANDHPLPSPISVDETEDSRPSVGATRGETDAPSLELDPFPDSLDQDSVPHSSDQNTFISSEPPVTHDLQPPTEPQKETTDFGVKVDTTSVPRTASIPADESPSLDVDSLGSQNEPVPLIPEEEREPAVDSRETPRVAEVLLDEATPSVDHQRAGPGLEPVPLLVEDDVTAETRDAENNPIASSTWEGATTEAVQEVTQVDPTAEMDIPRTSPSSSSITEGENIPSLDEEAARGRNEPVPLITELLLDELPSSDTVVESRASKSKSDHKSDQMVKEAQVSADEGRKVAASSTGKECPACVWCGVWGTFRQERHYVDLSLLDRLYRENILEDRSSHNNNKVNSTAPVLDPTRREHDKNADILEAGTWSLRSLLKEGGGLLLLQRLQTYLINLYQKGVKLADSVIKHRQGDERISWLGDQQAAFELPQRVFSFSGQLFQAVHSFVTGLFEGSDEDDEFDMDFVDDIEDSKGRAASKKEGSREEELDDDIRQLLRARK